MSYSALVNQVGDLPGPLTSFIGRGSAIELVRERLSGHRLVSVVGPGGCGKTRLVIEVARRVAGGRVCFVDMSGISGDQLVPGAVLMALGVTRGHGTRPLETLTVTLAKRKLLVVLDNCEHLLGACAALVGALGTRCPNVQVLATSRERLGVPGEAVVDLGGLELPGPGGTGEAWVLGSEAGRLFGERARLARADFSFRDDDDAIVVAEICHRLDGMPLAIEMAAARVRVMSVSAIASGLSDRFSLLAGGDRGAPSRHRSLLACIEWSCALLSGRERALLSRLSVFASGFSLPAAEEICAGDGLERDEVFGLLASLVEKSLVQAAPGADRFRLHESIHAYARVALGAEGATAHLRDRHLDYFSESAKAMAKKGEAGDVSPSDRVLEADLDNLRAALDWSAESKQYDLGASLLSSLHFFLYELGLASETLALCERFLAEEIEPSLRASLLFLASLCSRWRDPPMSARLASELVSLGRSLGDRATEAAGLVWSATMKQDSDPDEALRTATEGTNLARATGKQVVEALGLSAKGWALIRLGRPAEALTVAEQALRVAERCHWDTVHRSARTALSWALKCTGRLERAYAVAVLMARAHGAPPWMDVHGAEIRACQGKPEPTDLLEREISITKEAGDTYRSMLYARALRRILIAKGEEDRAYELLDAAVGGLESLGMSAMCVEERAVLAELAIGRGDLDIARGQLDACSWTLPRTAEPRGAPVFRAESRLARARGDHVTAHGLACEGLAAAFEGGHFLWVVELLELVAITCSELGSPSEAARLLGAAEAQRDLTSYVRRPSAAAEVAAVLSAMRSDLGDDPLDQMMSAGRALSVEQAVGHALRGRGRRRRASSGWDSLTSSERRVASLVGLHLTNAEIGERLFISTATVKSHLNRVFAKLGVSNRRELVAIAQPHSADELRTMSPARDD